MIDERVTIETDEGPMDAFIAVPDGAAEAAAATGSATRAGGRRGPALVVLQEAYGVNAHIREVCRRLAREGYVAIAPELFHRAGRGVEIAYSDHAKIMPFLDGLDNDGLERDVRAALAHVRAHPRVDPAKVGAIGWCMGGFTAFLAACRTDVATTVAFYGGGLVRPRPNIGLTPLVNEAGAIAAPILLLFGEADHGIPPTDVEAVRAALTAAGKRFEIVVYPGAGHGFFCDERPVYHAEAAAAAWARTVAWLHAQLPA